MPTATRSLPPARFISALLAAVSLTAVLIAAPGCGLVPKDPTPNARAETRFRGLWITRWDYKTAEDVSLAISRAADAGFTDIFWQVRGQADAFYPSHLEPWGEEILTGDGSPPDYDPLALAIDEARASGVRLHAWINVMPLWKGAEPPADPTHPYHSMPRVRLFDQDNQPQPLNDHYVTVNPASPEAHNHIMAVVRDILRRYDVDGLHLDYIRFVSDTLEDGKLYPGDGRTISRYYESGGGLDPSTDAGRAEYRAWIRDRITELVMRISSARDTIRPDAMLTAAVWRRPELARDTYLQDAPRWLDEGLIDRALPMIYREQDADFASDLNAWLDAANGRAVSPGIGIYKHPPGASANQMRRAADTADGYALFAYASLWETPNPDEDKSMEATLERERRLDYIRSTLAR